MNVKVLVIVIYLLLFMIMSYCLYMLIFRPVVWQSLDMYKHINCVIPITVDVVTIRYVMNFILYGYLIIYVIDIPLAATSTMNRAEN